MAVTTRPGRLPTRLARAVLRRVRNAARPTAASAPVAVRRSDPVPPMQPFPPGKVIFAVDGVPRVHGGRTTSILTKARLFKEKAGKDSMLITLYDSSQIDDLAHEFTERGILSQGVTLASLHDFYPDETEFTGVVVEHPVEEPGLQHRRDPDKGTYEYFDNGVLVMSKRFDYAGRLIVRDHFNGARTCTRSDEFWPDGSYRRQVFMDLYFGVARQELFFRHDGTLRLSVWWAVNPITKVRSPERVTLFDSVGRPERVLTDYEEVLHSCLDQLVGDQPAFICCEARRIDPWLLSYDRPNVKKVFVLHNAHIRPPYDRIGHIRPIYRPLLEKRHDVDAVVFLTEAQRADAEAHFGHTDRFYVIPHSAAPAALDPHIVRDPNRIVMMVRLDQQKRLPDAIKAFELVHRDFPDARLEIYGRGPEEVALRALIASLNLAGSVILAGYTNNPSRVYQSAGLSLLTSAYEGFGLAVLESLNNSCPVVSYDLRYGPSDIISHGQNGFLVANGDIVALAAQIKAVLGDRELLDQLIEAAPMAATAFSEDAFVARWSDLYNRLSRTLPGGAD